MAEVVERPKLAMNQAIRILCRYALCPWCGKGIMNINCVEWDHIIPRALGGSDDETNMQPLHRECHAEKTNGKPHLRISADKHEIARARRLSKAEEEFRRTLLNKKSWEEQVPIRSRWPKRPMVSRNSFKVERR